MSAAVGGAGVADSSAVAAAPAATPAASSGVALDAIEWGIGIELSAELEALHKHAAKGNRLAVAVLREYLASQPGAGVIETMHTMWLEALRTQGAGAARSPKEREYAAHFHSMRELRARVVTACARPGEPRRIRQVDITSSAPTRMIELVALLGVDAPILERMAAECVTALTTSEPLSSRLEIAYDSLDFTPARVAQRLHLLRMDGVGSISGPSDEEREYAARFKSLRRQRQELREHIGGKGTAAAAVHGDSAVVRAAILQLAVHEQSKEMCTAAFEALTRAGGPESTASQATRAAAFSTLLACMHAHLEHEGPALRACAALHALSLGLVDAAGWVPTDAVPMLLQMMTIHSGSSRVTLTAISLLALWTEGKQIVPALAAPGAISLIVAAVAKHPSNKMAMFACLLLHDLAHARENVPLVVEAGGIPALVMALTHHGSDLDVALNACEALRWISIEKPEYAATALVAGAIPPVVAALIAHPRHDEVAFNACVVIEVILEQTSLRVNAEVDPCKRAAAEEEVDMAVSQVADAGGIPAMVSALVAHVDEETTPAMVARSFAVTCQVGRDRRAAIAAAGGIPALVSFLKTASAESKILASTAQALSLLAEDSGDRCQAIAAAGGIPLLVTALSAVQSKPWPQAAAEFACFAVAALKSIADTRDNAAAVVAAGAVPAVIAFLKAEPEGEVVDFRKSAEHALLLLGRVIECGFASAIVEAGGAAEIVSAMSTIATTVEVATAACHAALSLEALDPTGTTAGCIVAILNRQVDSTGCAQVACSTLASFAALSETSRMATLSAGAVPAVIAAMTAHLGSAAVVSAAGDALVELATTAEEEASILHAVDSAVASSVPATAAAAGNAAAQEALQRVRQRLSA